MNLFDVFPSFFLSPMTVSLVKQMTPLFVCQLYLFVCLFEMNEVVEDGFFFHQLYPYNCVTRETYDPLS